MSLKKLAVQGVIWSLIDKVTNQIVYLVVILYLARKLGPEDFGLIGMLTVFVLLANSMVNSGFSQALIQRSNRVTERETSTVFYINLVIAGFLYTLLYLLAPLIADFYNEERLIKVSRILFLILIINSFSIVARAKLTISVDFKSQTVANTTGTVIGSVVAIYLANNGYGYWALVMLTLLKGLIITVVLCYRSKWIPKLIFCFVAFKRLFKFGSNLLVAGLIATTVNNTYILLIGRYFSAVQVGYFTQATTLTQSLSGMITSTLQGVTYPILTSVNEDKKRMVRIYKKLIEITMLVALPIMFGFASVADVFTEIVLGEEWLPMVPVLILLSFARLITPISGINMNILNAVGRSDLFLRVDLIKLPIIFLGLYFAIPYGIIGVAWAMVATIFLSFFINAYYPGKLFGFGAWAQIKVAYKMLISAVVMYFTVRYINHESIIIELVFKVLGGAITYMAMLRILRVDLFMRMLNNFPKGFKI